MVMGTTISGHAVLKSTLLLALVLRACSKPKLGRAPLQRTTNFCSTCRGPVHSWRTFPVSFHCSRPDTRGATGLEWLPEDLEALGRYPLVTLEKWQGSQAFSTDVCDRTGNCDSAGNVFCWEEDAWIAAAKQIKDRYPNVSIAVWMDTELIYTGWTWPPPANGPLNRTLNPDVKSPCSAGHFRPAEFLEMHTDYSLKNSSGLPALEPWSGCHVYDHSRPEVRQYWTRLCLDLTASGVIDGCGADFSALEENRWAAHTAENVAKKLGLNLTTAQAWTNGHRQAMIDTTQALGDGILIGKDSFELGDHVNAVLQEGCPASNHTITMLRNLTATARSLQRRLVYQCHGRGASESVMAAFLCGAGPDHYFAIGGWHGGAPGFPNHWNDAFAKPLGDPLSDAEYDTAAGTWTRTFASGTIVQFDTTNNTGSIEWRDDRSVIFSKPPLFSEEIL